MSLVKYLGLDPDSLPISEWRQKKLCQVGCHPLAGNWNPDISHSFLMASHRSIIPAKAQHLQHGCQKALGLDTLALPFSKPLLSVTNTEWGGAIMLCGHLKKALQAWEWEALALLAGSHLHISPFEEKVTSDKTYSL